MTEPNLIKQVCKDYNLSYKDLAKEIGMKYNTINRLASSNEISEQIETAIKLLIKTKEQEKELEEYNAFKQFFMNMLSK